MEHALASGSVFEGNGFEGVAVPTPPVPPPSCSLCPEDVHGDFNGDCVFDVCDRDDVNRFVATNETLTASDFTRVSVGNGCDPSETDFDHDLGAEPTANDVQWCLRVHMRNYPLMRNSSIRCNGRSSVGHKEAADKTQGCA